MKYICKETLTSLGQWIYPQKVCIYTEKVWAEERIDSLRGTFKRYLDSGKEIPLSWIKEYNQRIREINNIK